jgi:DNA-binding FrmR family transcriptional regulator
MTQNAEKTLINPAPFRGGAKSHLTNYNSLYRPQQMDYFKRCGVNLKKAKSHLDKILKMVENKEYCINIMQQNLAVIGLLKSAHQMLMESHLNTCFKNAMASKNEKIKQKMIDEILKVSKLANK